MEQEIREDWGLRPQRVVALSAHIAGNQTFSQYPLGVIKENNRIRLSDCKDFMKREFMKIEQPSTKSLSADRKAII